MKESPQDIITLHQQVKQKDREIEQLKSEYVRIIDKKDRQINLLQQQLVSITNFVTSY